MEPSIRQPTERRVSGRLHPPALEAGGGGEPLAVEARPSRGGSRRRLRRAVVRLFVACLALELIYVLVGNYYLNSFSLHNFVNRSPENFRMDWSVARTWYPGAIRLNGVRLSGRGSQDIWFCAVHDCSFTVSLPRLLWRRVDCRELNATGVDFRLGREDPLSGRETRLGHPPIPPLLSPARQIKAPSVHSPWSVGVAQVSLRNVFQVWTGGLRVTGRGEIRGNVELVTQGSFQARLDTWRVPLGEVGISGLTVSTNADLSLSGQLGPLVFAQSRGEKIFNELDASLDLKGELIDLGGLAGRVDPSSSIRLGGTGILNASIKVVRGTYWPGSRLEIQSPAMKVTTGNYSWVGKATLTDRIELGADQRPRAHLQLEETQLELLYRDEPVAGARGPRLSLESIAHDLRLVGRFADADLQLQISPMLLPDASVLNTHLPQPLAKVFQSGNVFVGLQINRTADQGIVGSVELTGDDLTAHLAAKQYRVDARLNARFAVGPHANGRFNLAESALVLTNVSTPRLTPRQLEPWSARIELTQAELNTDGPWTLHAGVAMSMHDTRPILAVLRSLPDSPGWLRWIPTIKGLNGQFDLEASNDRVSLSQLALAGRGTQIQAELEILDQKALGLLYARYGLISLGVEFLEEERSWHLLGAKRWYERQARARAEEAR